MIASYFRQPAIVGWAAFVGVSTLSAGIYYAAVCAWISWLARRQMANPVVVAGAWVACELARTHLLVANPWALAAYSQVPWSMLTQVADATGPYGVSILVVWANVLLARHVAPAFRPHRPAAAIVAFLATFGAALAYGHWRLGKEFTSGEPVTVAIVQGMGSQAHDAPAERGNVRLTRYLAMTDEAMASRPSLVVWPETAVTFLLQDDSVLRRRLLEANRALSTDLIVGGLAYTSGPDGGSHHNSVFLLRGGRLRARYDKVRLVPIAEEAMLGQGGGRLRLVAAREQRALPTRLGPAGVSLCFELMYPDLIRRAGRHSVLLVNLANDSWFGSVGPARHELDIATLRAVENRRYLVRSTATGISAIIDPHGRVVAESGFGRPEVLHASVVPAGGTSPYQRVGDLGAWMMVLFAGVRSVQAALRTREEPDRACR
jgi:apolipoprotein N-acyltransferase